MAKHPRVLLSEDPYNHANRVKELNKRGLWPCKWIVCPNLPAPPFVTAYRKHFSLDKAATIRVHVSADERYELFLDGERVGRGSERGDADHWLFETYDLNIEAGEHVLVARVWSVGEDAPYAQMTVYPGFILSPQEPEHVELIGTGVAGWESRILNGYEFTPYIVAWGTGLKLAVHGEQFDWGWETGVGDGWQAVEARHDGCQFVGRNDYEPLHLMQPAMLPAMLEEPRQIGTVRHVANVPAEAPPIEEFPYNTTHDVPIRAADNLAEEQAQWQQFIVGQSTLIVPPHTRKRVILDLDDYYCAYPEVTISGGKGAAVRVHWQESLYEDYVKTVKGNRDEIEGKRFITVWWGRDGVGDRFYSDGGQNRRFDTLWWECGRYIEIYVETHDEPLTLERFAIRETRYPFEQESAFTSDDTRLSEVEPIMRRVLQMCSHETYMDCPYFEQLQYIGDTRLQVLTTFVLTHDDRLPRKALATFDWSRINYGLTQSRYPSRVRQITRPFSIWWVAMLHDFALWRGDLEFISQRMIGARQVLDVYRQFLNEQGLIELPYGPNYNFMDWVPSWSGGTPKVGDRNINSPANWQYVLVLRQAAQLEEWLDEAENAARWRRIANQIETQIHATFWDETRGLFANDVAHTGYSEHSQCLALLAHELGGQLSETQRERLAAGLLNDTDLDRTTIYFTHYLFEAYRLLGRIDRFFERMEGWFELKRLGLKTTVEMPEPTRSDCHAWGAHPLYHYFSTLLGIRPIAPGFAKVQIAPQLGSLTRAEGTIVHPRGEIKVLCEQSDGFWHAHIELPQGVEGSFVWGGQEHSLKAGAQELVFDCRA
jgi:hypothetical protein